MIRSSICEWTGTRFSPRIQRFGSRDTASVIFRARTSWCAIWAILPPLAVSLRRAFARGKQQPARYLPTQVAECTTRRDGRADRAVQRFVQCDRTLFARERSEAEPGLRPSDCLYRVPV